MSWRALRGPLAITLLVTLLRLTGELCGFDARLFGTAAGGGGALIGIGWLIPVFGWWFGLRLARAGEAPLPWPALGWFGAGIAIVAIGFTVTLQWIGTTPMGMAVSALGCVAGAATAWHGWPRLCRWLLCYAALARVPIAVITALGIANDWGTHYEKLAEGAPSFAPLPRFGILMLAQATMWLPITILLGGVAGVLAARPHAGRAALVR